MLTAEPATSVIPGPGLVEITLPLCTFFDVFFVTLPSVQFSAGITVSATARGAPASAIVLHGLAAGGFTVSVADVLLFAVCGSGSEVETLAASLKVPAEGAATTIDTLAPALAAPPSIVQLTACPATAQLPNPATAERILRAPGTVSVNVIGAVPGPERVTVNKYSPTPKAVIDAGIAAPVTDTSSFGASCAETLTRPPV